MRVLLALALVVAVAIGGVVFYVDRIAASAIEEGGTYALGVDTDMGSVSLGFLTGRFGLRRLAIDNPPGFDQEHFLSIDRGELSVGIDDLRGERVEIPSIALSGVDVSLERKGGKKNYDVILNNLKQLESGGGGSNGGGSDKGFVVRELVIQEIRAHVSLAPVEGKLTELDLEIPEIRLKELGGSEGVAMSEPWGTVTKAVLEAIARKGDMLPFGLAGELRGRLGRLEQVGVRIPASVDDAQQQLRDAAGKKLGETLNRFLGGNK